MEINRASFMGQAQSLMGLVSRGVGEAAGTELGREAGEILGQLVGSMFTGSTEGKPLDPNQRFESPVSRFGDQLKQLGVTFQTLGEVLNALGKLIGNDRGMSNFPNFPGLPGGSTPGGTTGAPGGTTGAPGGTTGIPTTGGTTGGTTGTTGTNTGATDVLKDFGGALDDKQKAQIAFQQKMQAQTEAFSLISNILKMVSDSTKQFYGNLK